MSNLSQLEHDITTVIQKAEESLGLKAILDKPGLILYSSYKTLTRGKYYFLGLNPGGTDDGTPTIRQSFCDLRTYQGNAFFPGDPKADWSGTKKCNSGEHPYQRAFRMLFDELGEDPRTVCASNLIFKRSTDARGSGYPKLAEPCWQVHKTMLEIVLPKVIITFGMQAFNYIALKLKGGQIEQEETQTGFWKWKHTMLEGERPLIGVRHPSRYPLKKEVAGEISEFLDPIIRNNA
jgi:hypothetical protein